MKGEVRDNVKAGVLEPMVSKVKSLKSALEACTALLRIDDRVSDPYFPRFARIKADLFECLRLLYRQSKKEETMVTGTDGHDRTIENAVSTPSVVQRSQHLDDLKTLQLVEGISLYPQRDTSDRS
jgi:hypothetical protein